MLDPTLARPGDRIGVRWSVDPGVLLGPDVVAYCWSGREWIAVWVTRDVFGEPVVDLVAPGEELSQNDNGFTERVGVVLIPSEAPPGVYRIGGGGADDARVEVRSE